MRRALIVGCGYVGGALGLVLADAGWRVWGLRRSGPSPAPIRSLRADLARAGELRATLSTIDAPLDALVYCVAAAGFDRDAYRAAYVDGLVAALDALAGAPQRLVFASSTSVYGQQDGAWVDERSATEPTGFSGEVMLEAERLARSSHPAATVVRFGGIYGPGRTRLIDRVRAGLAVTAEPAPFRSRIHRDDCAAALQHVLDLERPAPCYLAVDDEPASMAEVEAWLCARLGRQQATLKRDQQLGARRATNKRCRNALLRSSGYAFRYPTYRQGYDALLQLAR